MVKNIQALRGLAASLVLMAHLTKIEEKYCAAPVVPKALSIGISGVDIFFVISGFVMVLVTHHQARNLRQTASFLTHRAARIYPIYWFYSALVLGLFLLHPAWVNSAQDHHADLLSSFQLLPLPQGTVPLLGVGWSLIHEMYFYLAFTLLVCAPRRLWPVALALWAAAIGVYAVRNSGTAPASVQLITHPLTLEFILGCFIGLAFIAPWRGYPRTALALGLTLWVVHYVIFSQTVGYGMDAVEWRRPLVFGVPAGLVVYGLTLLERNGGYTLPGWLVALGDRSYSLYLSHILTFSALGHAWKALNIENPVLNVPVLITFFLCALLVGHISYTFLEKPLQKKLKTLLLRSSDPPRPAPDKERVTQAS